MTYSWQLPDGTTHAPSKESGLLTRCGLELAGLQTWWAVPDEPSCKDCAEPDDPTLVPPESD